ncbi:MAG: hypothetical protein DRQ10_00510 [Candidatus Hydrothermota bacterium]|nr:MAG: hypothetical protein DRQ10_00510 [Candidatus Hydrothermae bacterium]
MATTIWVWVAAFFTLAILSFLYKDNPFYRIAESVYVGSSAAYMLLFLWSFDVKPKMIDAWVKGSTTDRLILIIPITLSIFMLMRFIPKLRWISRWAIAFTVGMGAGLGVAGLLQGFVVPQIKGTIVPLWIANNFKQTINNWIIVLGTLTTISYFFFSRKHTGVFGKFSRTGVMFIMIAFGATFGFTIMARVSLLIGRLYFLLHDWLGLI